MYNSDRVTIFMVFPLIEILCSKVRNNVEAYPCIHKEQVIGESATMGIFCFKFSEFPKEAGEGELPTPNIEKCHIWLISF
jgi:hypothetical protein